MDRRGDGSDHVRRGKYALSCFMGQCTLQQVVGPGRIYLKKSSQEYLAKGIRHGTQTPICLTSFRPVW